MAELFRDAFPGLSAIRRALDAWLFRPSAPAPPLTARRTLIGLALALGGVVLVLARLGLAAPLDAVWAEDGAIFLDAALNEPFLDPVAAQHGGYVHVVPRLLAELAAAVPLSLSAEMLAVGSAAMLVLTAFVVWWTSAAHFTDPVLRGALAASVLLLPMVGMEPLASIAYLWFFMAFATFWLLLWHPPSLLKATAGAAYVALAVLSAPLALLFAPIALARAVVARGRKDFVLLAGYFAAAAVQMIAIAGPDVPDTVDAGFDVELLAAYPQRVVGGVLFGQYGEALLWLGLGWALVVVLVAAFAALVALAARPGSHRLLALLALALSVTCFAVSGVSRGAGLDLYWAPGEVNAHASRYAVVPALFLVTAILLVLQTRPGTMDPARWAAVRRAALVGLAVVAASAFYVGDEYRLGQRWTPALEAAKTSCAAGAATVEVPINPPGWHVTVPCRKVSG